MTSTLDKPPVLPSQQELDEAYEACEKLTRDSMSNFYYAFLSLPVEQRRAIYATYAFFRLCDDVVDDQDRPTDPATELAEVKSKLGEAFDGTRTGPIWTALADSQRRFSIAPEHYVAVIEGCEMDVIKSRYANFEELVEYCEKVASAVGLVCIEVCGYDDISAVQHAVDLGIAMQLTNITRDVAEDAAIGRIYLPQDEIARFGYSEQELLDGVVNDSFRKLIKFQVERARDYFDRGNRALPAAGPTFSRLPAGYGGGVHVDTRQDRSGRLRRYGRKGKAWQMDQAHACGEAVVANSPAIPADLTCNVLLR